METLQDSHNAGNTLKYELYSSSEVDEQVIKKYEEHLSKISSQQTIGLKKHDTHVCFGKVRFDQNIEDEWLTIWCLYELSKLDKDLVIRVYDRDGDILLIEAAEHLPEWLESSKSKNRVFINNGLLHIIPEHIELKDLETSAQIIRSGEIETKASSAIQKAIGDQLSGMPDKEEWLKKKFSQLDAIITENSFEDTVHLHNKFRESLTLASVMAMDDEDLRTSPISSVSSSASASSSSSSAWVTGTEQEEDEENSPQR